jgi:pyruvate kinase
MTIQIHATLDPASRSESVIEDLLRAGAHVFRLNLSHCAPQDVPHWVERIHRCSRSVHRPAMIAPDIRGRKLRLGPLCDDQATLTVGQTYLLHCVTEGQELPGDNRSTWVNHPLLAATVAIGKPSCWMMEPCVCR